MGLGTRLRVFYSTGKLRFPWLWIVVRLNTTDNNSNSTDNVTSPTVLETDGRPPPPEWLNAPPTPEVLPGDKSAKDVKRAAAERQEAVPKEAPHMRRIRITRDLAGKIVAQETASLMMMESSARKVPLSGFCILVSH